MMKFRSTQSPSGLTRLRHGIPSLVVATILFLLATVSTISSSSSDCHLAFGSNHGFPFIFVAAEESNEYSDQEEGEEQEYDEEEFEEQEEEEEENESVQDNEGEYNEEEHDGEEQDNDAEALEEELTDEQSESTGQDSFKSSESPGAKVGENSSVLSDPSVVRGTESQSAPVPVSTIDLNERVVADQQAQEISNQSEVSNQSTSSPETTTIDETILREAMEEIIKPVLLEDIVEKVGSSEALLRFSAVASLSNMIQEVDNALTSLTGSAASSSGSPLSIGSMNDIGELLSSTAELLSQPLPAIKTMSADSVSESDSPSATISPAGQEAYQNILVEARQVEDLIHQLNVRMLEGVFDDLTEIEAGEMKRREQASKLDTAASEIANDEGSGLSHARLQKLLSIERGGTLGTVVESVEETVLDQFYEFMVQVIEEEAPNAIRSITSQRRLESHRDLGVAPDQASCVTATAGAQMVVDSLDRLSDDGVGLVDHARVETPGKDGGRVVHEYTSPTYNPRAENNFQVLGHPLWRSFIPQDWEDYYLPKGWKEWSIPSFLGFSPDSTALAPPPPETVLYPDTYPGSCWPMAGTKGHLTIELPYPILVESVTIDHASPLLFLANGDGNERLSSRASAPRGMTLFGYLPCDKKCDGFSFDLRKKDHLLDFEYNMEKGGTGLHVQTFTVPKNSASKTLHSPLGLEDGLPTGGSCSAPPESATEAGAASCVADIPKGSAAVELKIHNNWGNDDYTCIYRVRIHGRRAPR
jgi:Sad1 / UNC-like C-terminal